ncbi:hypothetical protein HDU76_001933 [Blyttiomyces sp. JEL0837]|nr:hypothetical protein HDU76_001933 [Blyttiomyces sp. JEL0837]
MSISSSSNILSDINTNKSSLGEHAEENPFVGGSNVNTGDNNSAMFFDRPFRVKGDAKSRGGLLESFMKGHRDSSQDQIHTTNSNSLVATSPSRMIHRGGSMDARSPTKTPTGGIGSSRSFSVGPLPPKSTTLQVPSFTTSTLPDPALIHNHQAMNAEGVNHDVAANESVPDELDQQENVDLSVVVPLRDLLGQQQNVGPASGVATVSVANQPVVEIFPSVAQEVSLRNEVEYLQDLGIMFHGCKEGGPALSVDEIATKLLKKKGNIYVVDSRDLNDNVKVGDFSENSNDLNGRMKALSQGGLFGAGIGPVTAGGYMPSGNAPAKRFLANLGVLVGRGKANGGGSGKHDKPNAPSSKVKVNVDGVASGVDNSSNIGDTVKIGSGTPTQKVIELEYEDLFYDSGPSGTALASTPEMKDAFQEDVQSGLKGLQVGPIKFVDLNSGMVLDEAGVYVKMFLEQHFLFVIGEDDILPELDSKNGNGGGGSRTPEKMRFGKKVGGGLFLGVAPGDKEGCDLGEGGGKSNIGDAQDDEVEEDGDEDDVSEDQDEVDEDDEDEDDIGTGEARDVPGGVSYWGYEEDGPL